MTDTEASGIPLVVVLNGPNLNLLGSREPAIYGSETLADVETKVRAAAEAHGIAVEFQQSNHEGALVDAIQSAATRAIGIIINPGAYAHTSIALRDAIAGTGATVVEVHVSNVHAREAFRHHSHMSAVATAVIVGAGTHGYLLALDYLAQRVQH